MSSKADTGKRILAVILDGIIFFIPFIILYLILNFILPNFIASGLASIAYAVAFGARDALPIKELNGQSPGKRLLELQAVRTGGGPCTMEDSLKRNATIVGPSAINGAISLVLGWIPLVSGIISVLVGLAGLVLLCIELYKVISDPQGNRIGDMYAGTTVVGKTAAPQTGHSAPPPPPGQPQTPPPPPPTTPDAPPPPPPA